MTFVGWADADPVQVVDAADYEMGTEFIAVVDLTITHVRVFSGASPAAFPGRLGRIWSTAGLQLGQATMPTNLPPGWNLYALDVPVARIAGQRFIVSFNTGGAYAATPTAFDVAHNSSNGALTSRKATDAANGNGIFNNTPNLFPTSNFNNTFYGIDVGYDLGIGGNTAPVITGLSLVAAGLGVTATITATDAETLAGGSYLIDWQDGSTTAASSGSHTYASAGLKAVLATVTDAGGLSDHFAAAVLLQQSSGLLETRTAQVVDALVSRSGALGGFRLSTAETWLPDLTTVWDGPEFRASGDHAPGGQLVIGYSGDDPEALEPAATTGLNSRVMAAATRPRDELGTLNCRAIYDRADTAKQARDNATAIMAAVADLCRSDPTLGIDASATIGGVIVQCWVTAGTLLQYLQNGYTAEWEFTVTFKDRV